MTADLMSLQNLADTLSLSYSTLRRYSKSEGVSKMMGGTTVTGKLGLRYPASSLDRWQQLVKLHNAQAVTPQTAAAILTILWDTPEGFKMPVASMPEAGQRADGEEIIVALTRIAAILERTAFAYEKVVKQASKRKKKKRR